MIRFEIGGRQVDPNSIGDALMAAVLEEIRASIKERVGAIRDPETGEFPTVVIRGESLDNLTMSVEGSPKLLGLVKQRLGIEESGLEQSVGDESKAPVVFLSYTSGDTELAERIANDLQANGIETWWDKWCIAAGDSLRQKIEEGLSGCTHFLVLLTPDSINKPWVNQEMDAGLIRKLANKCKFLPVRHQLHASKLPPILSAMHAPEIRAGEDITQLINDIHGVSRKPPLGPIPKSIRQASKSKTGNSPAADMIAKLFVECSAHGTFADPQFTVEELAEQTGLTLADTKDSLYEISRFFKDIRRNVLVEASFFTEFDKYWKPWNPADDALKLAADIANDETFPADAQQIADLYGWEPRRLNPAITYLLDRDIVRNCQTLGVREFVMRSVIGKEDELRRFLKSRT